MAKYGSKHGSEEGGVPWWEGQHICTLDLGSAKQHLVEDLILEQSHGPPALPHIPPLLDGVGHIPIPPAVVLQSSMPAQQ